MALKRTAVGKYVARVLAKGTAMALKPEQLPALTHEQRVQRLQQLAQDLATAVDLAEEQRRILRDLAHDANELADLLSSQDGSGAPARRRRKR
jgi:hypothetical protein